MRFSTIRTVILLLADKLAFSKINSHVGVYPLEIRQSPL